MKTKDLKNQCELLKELFEVLWGSVMGPFLCNQPWFPVVLPIPSLALCS